MVTIRGASSSGEIISKTARYDAYRILAGYHFAQYHYSQWEKKIKSELRKKRWNHHMWYGNIVSVIENEKPK